MEPQTDPTLMETLTDLLGGLNNFVWGPVMLVLILGTGLFLTAGLRVMPLHRLGYGFRMLCGAAGRWVMGISPPSTPS
jgi:AGCS family alanine or glycine:cation symporter